MGKNLFYVSDYTESLEQAGKGILWRKYLSGAAEDSSSK
jgi:hypothetical protein